ncbi:hypothetical protein GMOD_00003816 [Pyrenophora seminiperda CCB06]|uniref:Uncharacterized protein n=1 Tax=Pyrenophora seminiperda CCB06 TaxID=1302712 RepID=A0A3M7M048_9PLEO|nr:hypothetical protein GMOD_00003816 [Pyrenophora seminiperda CCB06]
MCTHGDVMFFTREHRLVHDQWVAAHVSVDLMFLHNLSRTQRGSRMQYSHDR